MKTVLVVDDEPDLRELLKLTLEQMSFGCDLAEDYTTAKKKVDTGQYFLCLADMRLPDGDGIELVHYIQKVKPELPVAIITAYGNVEGAVNTLKAGAFDYVSKPINLKMLRDLISSAERLSKNVSKLTSAEQVLLGKSNPIISLRAELAKIARSQAPVYIYGESGTGKELVARLIHQLGPRSDKPFIPVNCGAIPQELMESEFFGHKKGSFTGAHADKHGFFQAADGGSIFLDEIGDLPLMMQVKLLRAIQEKAIRAIGDNHETPVDVRIISASHKYLDDLVWKDDFRQDLYYRLNVISLEVPPLRDRVEDIPILVEKFLKQNAPDYRLSEAAFAKLRHYAFPGNVRELENIIERAVAFSENHRIDAVDLKLPESAPGQAIQGEAGIETDSQANLDDVLDNQERDIIVRALEEHRWNKTKTAKSLGITLRALRYRLKKYGID